MEEERQAELRRATALYRPVARRARLARWNGAGYLVFGAGTVMLQLGSWSWAELAVGAALIACGVNGRRNARRLAQGALEAPRRLAQGEGALLLVYGVLEWAGYPATTSGADAELAALDAQLERLGYSALVSDEWLRTTRRTVGAGVVALALLYQGGLALWYLNVRPALARYLTGAPAWARELVQSVD
jgi:hypothetical protein